MSEDLLRFARFDLRDLREALRVRLLSIRAVEVTQGVQHLRSTEHLTDPADRGPDNSVRIVAEKPAWVRVYVRALFGPITGVTGTLTVERRQHGFLWTQVAQLSPRPPGSVTAESTLDYDVERGEIGRTLNFVLPADVVCGRLRLRVDISGGGMTAQRTLEVDATLRQTLRMRIVPVSYDGTDAAGNALALPAPSLADAQTTAAWSLLVYPVRSTPQIGLTAAVELTFPLTGSPASAGGCAQSWIDLNVLVAQARTADGAQAGVFYYGLVPAAVPIGANSGCASSGVTSGRVGGGVTMAHEFGHALGWPHAPCGNVGTVPTFPVYEPYAAASVGEYGLDVSNGAVKSPVDHRDFMSYCGPRWISLFNYERALDHQALRPEVVCNDRPWIVWDEILVDDWWWLRRGPLPDPPPWYDERVQPVVQRQRVLSVIGVRDATGRVEVRSVTRASVESGVEGGGRTGLVLELLDERGGRIAAGVAQRLTSLGCGGGCSGGGGGGGGCGGCGGCGGAGCGDDGPYAFQALLPDEGRGVRLRLLEGDEELWDLDAPQKEGKPPRLRAKLSRKGELTLDWDAGSAAEVWVRWRSGRGEPQVLCIGGGSGARRLDASALPPGPLVLDAVAHDGFGTATSKEVVVEVPDRGPTVSILHPIDRRTLEVDGTLRLQGLVTDATGQPVDVRRAVWHVDGREVADALDVFLDAPEEGEHEARLSVDTAIGRGEATARFATVDPRRRAEAEQQGGRRRGRGGSTAP
jgi:hypothetical protein